MFKENRRTKLLTLMLSCFGLFMVLLDVTIVNNALIGLATFNGRLRPVRPGWTPRSRHG